MGTRSRIAVMHADVVKSVSCHWDGYLAYNGKILQQYYDSPKANNLVALGDISSLGLQLAKSIRSVVLKLTCPTKRMTNSTAT